MILKNIYRLNKKEKFFWQKKENYKMIQIKYNKSTEKSMN